MSIIVKVKSPGHTKDFKNSTYAAHTLYNGLPDKGGIILRSGMVVW